MRKDRLCEPPPLAQAVFFVQKKYRNGQYGEKTIRQKGAHRWIIHSIAENC